MANTSNDEIRQRAIDLGITLDGTETRAQLVQAINERVVSERPDALVDDAVLSEDVARKAAVLASRRLAERNFNPKLSGRKTTVNIHRGEGDPASVYLGLNGVGYKVQLGANVDLPEEVVQACLVDTKVTRYTKDDNGRMTGSYEASPYGYSIVGPACGQRS